MEKLTIQGRYVLRPIRRLAQGEWKLIQDQRLAKGRTVGWDSNDNDLAHFLGRLLGSIATDTLTVRNRWQGLNTARPAPGSGPRSLEGDGESARGGRGKVRGRAPSSRSPPGAGPVLSSTGEDHTASLETRSPSNGRTAVALGSATGRPSQFSKNLVAPARLFCPAPQWRRNPS